MWIVIAAPTGKLSCCRAICRRRRSRPSRLPKSGASTGCPDEALGALAAEERFLLSAWFLDPAHLLEISRIIGVHKATASRRIQRLTANLHKDLRSRLQAHGMSRAAADEALGIDPRDLEINLRALLQNSQSLTFLEGGTPDQP